MGWFAEATGFVKTPLGIETPVGTFAYGEYIERQNQLAGLARLQAQHAEQNQETHQALSRPKRSHLSPFKARRLKKVKAAGLVSGMRP